MTANLFSLIPASTPLIINVPHAGIYIPPELRSAMTLMAQTLPDTDWHVHLLYEFALELGAGLMVATHSRYVIDLNRDPAGVALYPGAHNTELCPAQTFAGEEIYLAGRAPTQEDVAARRARYWAPYHQRLREELETIRTAHGYAVLLDAHSILSRVPRFFAGRLPDFNLGTADGASCATDLQAVAHKVLSGATSFSAVANGRFKGGYITRHYGRPTEQVHALQLEIAQAAYMDEAPPYPWEPRRAAPLVDVLRELVGVLRRWRPDG